MKTIIEIIDKKENKVASVKGKYEYEVKAHISNSYGNFESAYCFVYANNDSEAREIFLNDHYNELKEVEEGKEIFFADGEKMFKKVFTPHAYLTTSNYGGIQIELDKTGEELRYKYYDDEPKNAEIEYDNKGAYFVMENKRTKYYLSEFLRIS